MKSVTAFKSSYIICGNQCIPELSYVMYHFGNSSCKALVYWIAEKTISNYSMILTAAGFKHNHQ